MLSDQRLLTVAEMIRRGNRVADIGTDHAYLAIHLIENEISTFVIAADIVDGPLENAKEHVEKAGLREKICIRKSDGLKNIHPNEIDTVVIAGMGGDVISKIISDAPWLKNEGYELLLQPMSSAPDLRRFLSREGFEIKEEKATLAADRIYSVMKAVFVGGKRQISTCEALVGKLCDAPDELALRYIERVKKINQKTVGELKKTDKKKDLLAELEDALREIDGILENGI